jgi:hypothetical protein
MIGYDVLKDVLHADRATFIHDSQGKTVESMLVRLTSAYGHESDPVKMHQREMGILLGFIRQAFDCGVQAGKDQVVERFKSMINSS